jgi:hypothetical protein
VAVRADGNLRHLRNAMAMSVRSPTSRLARWGDLGISVWVAEQQVEVVGDERCAAGAGGAGVATHVTDPTPHSVQSPATMNK